MAFVEVVKKAGKAATYSTTMSVVTAGGRSINKHSVLIVIGKDVADQAGWKRGDKLRVFFDQQDPTRVMLKPDPIGYTLTRYNDSERTAVRVPLHGWIGLQHGERYHCVEHQPQDDGLVLIFKKTRLANETDERKAA